ncbi:hypothetical protein FA95DRAFT_1596930 [Auriscalpium vulgare]|uniref:Uncharacterized protein n=1 Tax=Auriscalpium vulgare TaxID=40419 RepID=A0ACB8RLY7_9AGAM|nr:hypothetical protein FA95DRAFT_1596930 [Auriscalpium vulgare]
MAHPASHRSFLHSFTFTPPEMFHCILLVISAAVIDCGTQLARFARGTAALLVPSGRRSRRSWPWTAPAIHAAPIRAKIDAPTLAPDAPPVVKAPQPSSEAADVVPSFVNAPAATNAALQLCISPTALPSPSTLPLPPHPPSSGSNARDLQVYAPGSHTEASPLNTSAALLLLGLVVASLAVSSKRKIKGRPVSQWIFIVLTALAGVSTAPERMEPAAGGFAQVAALFGKLASFVGRTGMVRLVAAVCVLAVLSRGLFCYVRGYHMLRVNYGQLKYTVLVGQLEIDRLRCAENSLNNAHSNISQLQEELHSAREIGASATKAKAVLAWKTAALHLRSVEHSRIILEHVAEIKDLEAMQAALLSRCSKAENAARTAEQNREATETALVLRCNEAENAARVAEQAQDAQARELKALKTRIAAIYSESITTQADLRHRVNTTRAQKRDVQKAFKNVVGQLDEEKAENARLAMLTAGADARVDILVDEVARLRLELQSKDRAMTELREEVEAGVHRAGATDVKLGQAIAEAEKAADEAAQHAAALQEKDETIGALNLRIGRLQSQLQASVDAQVSTAHQNSLIIESLQTRLQTYEEDLKASEKDNTAIIEKNSLLEQHADKLKDELEKSSAKVKELLTTADVNAQQAEAAQRVQHRLDATARGYATSAKLLVVELAKTRADLQESEQQIRNRWPDDCPEAMAFLKEKAREMHKMMEENEGLEIKLSQAALLAEGLKDRIQILEEQLLDEQCSIVDDSGSDRLSTSDSLIVSLGSGRIATSSTCSISSILRRYEHLPPRRVLALALPSSSLASIEGFEPLSSPESTHSPTSPTPAAPTFPVCDTGPPSQPDEHPPSISTPPLHSTPPRTSATPSATRAPVVDWLTIESMAKEYMELELQFERKQASSTSASTCPAMAERIHTGSSCSAELNLAAPVASVVAGQPVDNLADAAPTTMSWAQWTAILEAEGAANAKP